jgi:hypothetical protein
MLKHLLICGLLLFVFSVSISYASVCGEGARAKQAVKRHQPCKTSEKLIPEKLLKIKPFSDRLDKSGALPSNLNKKAPASADTFESLIAPFIKSVAPIFYDHIIKRESKTSELRS